MNGLIRQMVNIKIKFEQILVIKIVNSYKNYCQSYLIDQKILHFFVAARVFMTLISGFIKEYYL